MVKAQHLVGKIADEQMREARTVVIGRIHSHARARHAIFTESNSGGNGFLFERAILFIQVKLVRLGVVGQDNVRPAIAVVVKDRDPEGLGCVVEEVRFLRSVFELAVAKIVPEPCSRALVRFGGAIGLMGTIQRAEEIARRVELEV